MKKAVFVGILSAVVFFFVGFMEVDNEFYESPSFIIKWPPTSRWEFPSTGLWGFWRHWTRTSPVIPALIALAAHYVLLRLSRPVKIYRVE